MFLFKCVSVVYSFTIFSIRRQRRSVCCRFIFFFACSQKRKQNQWAQIESISTFPLLTWESNWRTIHRLLTERWLASSRWRVPPGLGEKLAALSLELKLGSCECSCFQVLKRTAGFFYGSVEPSAASPPCLWILHEIRWLNCIKNLILSGWYVF